MIFKKNPHASIVVAASCCQIHVLYKKDLENITKKYPFFDKKEFVNKMSPGIRRVSKPKNMNININFNVNEVMQDHLLSPVTRERSKSNKTEVIRMKSFQINSKGIR